MTPTSASPEPPSAPTPRFPDDLRTLGAAGGEMVLVPTSLTRVARDWDEQQHDLDVAADAVAQAPAAGFTPAVARAAADFLRTWSGHVGEAAGLCEQQGDDLRAVLAAWLRTDEGVAYRCDTLLPAWARPW